MGSVITTGGTVVANYWNASNTGIDITVPLDNDASLTGGTLQIRANVASGGYEDLGSAHTILVAELGANKTLSFNAATFEALSGGLSNLEALSFTATITDKAGNTTTGTQSTTTITFDETPPVAFTVGSVITTGGTVVAGQWTPTNTSIDITVPLDNDATLTDGTLQIMASVDGDPYENLGTAHTILVGELNANKTLSFNAATFEALSSGLAHLEVITFTAIITDKSANATTGTESATTITFDETPPTIAITATNGSTGVTNGDSSSDVALTATFTTSEPSLLFTFSDIAVSNGVLSNFVAVSSTVYTALFTPTTVGPTTIEVPLVGGVGTFTDLAGNVNTLAATPFNWTFNLTTAVVHVTCNGEDDGTITLTPPTGQSETYEYDIAPFDTDVATTIGNLFIKSSYTSNTDPVLSGPAGTYYIGVRDFGAINFSYTPSAGTGIELKQPADAFEITATPTNFLCFTDVNKGVINVNFSSGGTTGVITYDLSTASGGLFGSGFVDSDNRNSSFNNLDLGTYYVGARSFENNVYCVAKKSGTTLEEVEILIEKPTELDLIVDTSPTKTFDPLCQDSNDGWITVQASGGNNAFPFYSYAATMDNSTVPTDFNYINTIGTFTQRSAGTWYLSLKDASGCILSTPLEFTLEAPDALTIGSVDKTDITCFGDDNGELQINMTSSGTGVLQYGYKIASEDDFTYGGSSLITDLGPGDSHISEALVKTTITSEANVVVSDVSGDIESGDVVTGTGISGDVTVTGVADKTITLSSNQTLIAGVQLTFTSRTSYTIAVMDDNDCIATYDKQLGIREPEELKGDFTRVFPSCADKEDGAIYSVISGGTLPYQFIDPKTSYWSSEGEDYPGLDLVDLDGSSNGKIYSFSLEDGAGCQLKETLRLYDGFALGMAGTGYANVNQVSGTVNSENNIILNNESNFEIGGFITTGAAVTGDGISGLVTVRSVVRVALTKETTITLSHNVSLTNGQLLTFPPQESVINCYSDNTAFIEILPTVDDSGESGNTANNTYSWNVISWVNSANVSIKSETSTAGKAQIPVFRNNRISNLGPDTYTAKVSNGVGCTVTFTHEVVGPDELVLSLSSPRAISGEQYDLTNWGDLGYITHNVTGGVLDYTVSSTWSESISHSPAAGAEASSIIKKDVWDGIWEETVIDNNGCTATERIEIKSPETAFDLNPISVTNVDCEVGGTAKYEITALINPFDLSSPLTAPLPHPIPEDQIKWYDQSGALTLDGTNDYLKLPDGLVQTLTDFTFEAWFKKDADNNWSRIMDFGSGEEINMFLTASIGTGGVPRFAIKKSGGGEETLTPIMPVATGEWVHYAVTIDAAASKGKLYINGILVAENTNMSNTPSDLGATNQNYIGQSQYSGDEFLDGTLDDVRIWSTVRTRSEIKENMFSELSGREDGLHAYYSFNEADPQLDNSDLSSITDQSSNTYDGQMNNFNADPFVGGIIGTLLEQYTGLQNITDLDADRYALTIQDTYGGFKIAEFEITGLTPLSLYGSEVDITCSDANLGNALNFNDLNSNRIAVAHSINLGITDNITLEAWIKPNPAEDTESQVLISKLSNSATSGFEISTGDGWNTIDFTISNGGISNTLSASGFSTDPPIINLEDGLWHHVAASYSTSTKTMAFYIDGTLFKSDDDVTDGLGSNTDQLTIGAEHDGAGDDDADYSKFFDGSIDEFRIWDDIRTIEEIGYTIDMPLANEEPNLTHYWAFDQGLPSGRNKNMRNLTYTNAGTEESIPLLSEIGSLKTDKDDKVHLAGANIRLFTGAGVPLYSLAQTDLPLTGYIVEGAGITDYDVATSVTSRSGGIMTAKVFNTNTYSAGGIVDLYDFGASIEVGDWVKMSETDFDFVTASTLSHTSADYTADLDDQVGAGYLAGTEILINIDQARVDGETRRPIVGEKVTGGGISGFDLVTSVSESLDNFATADVNYFSQSIDVVTTGFPTSYPAGAKIYYNNKVGDDPITVGDLIAVNAEMNPSRVNAPVGAKNIIVNKGNDSTGDYIILKYDEAYSNASSLFLLSLHTYNAGDKISITTPAPAGVALAKSLTILGIGASASNVIITDVGSDADGDFVTVGATVALYPDTQLNISRWYSKFKLASNQVFGANASLDFSATNRITLEYGQTLDKDETLEFYPSTFLVLEDAHDFLGSTEITYFKPLTTFIFDGAVSNIVPSKENQAGIQLSVLGGSGDPNFLYKWYKGAEEITTQTASILSKSSGYEITEPDEYSVFVTDILSGCSVSGSFIIDLQPTFSATAIITDPLCKEGSDGSIDLVISGPTDYAYSYEWSRILSVTATVSATTTADNEVVVTSASGDIEIGAVVTGTEISGVVTVTAVTASTLTLSTKQSLKTNDILTFTFYKITEDLDNLTDDTYTVDITEVNTECNQSYAFDVASPTTAYTVSIDITDETCSTSNNGVLSADITADVGHPSNYNYVWYNSPDALGTALSDGEKTLYELSSESGVHTVKVTDDYGCIITDTASVSQGGEMNFSASTTTNVTCHQGTDGTISIALSGGNNSYTYVWYKDGDEIYPTGDFAGSLPTALTGLPTGIYKVIAQDAAVSVSPKKASCSAEASFNITEPEDFTVTATSIDPICQNGSSGQISVNVSGATMGTGYAQDTDSQYALFSGVFDGTTYDPATYLFNFPSAAQSFAGFANLNADLWLSRFPDGGSITFLASVPSGGNVNVNFQFENLPFPDNTPAFSIANQLVSGSTEKTYTVDIPAQAAANSYSSILLFLVERDIDIMIKDVLITTRGNGYTYIWTKNPSGTATSAGTTPTISGLTGDNPTGDLYRLVLADNAGCVSESLDYTLTSPLTTYDINPRTTISETVTALPTETVQSNVSCNGADDGYIEVKITVDSGHPTDFDYAWYRGTTSDPDSLLLVGEKNVYNLAAGQYTFQIIDFYGCTKDSTYTVLEYPIMDLSTTAATKLINDCSETNDASIGITVSGGNIANTSYEWSKNDVIFNPSDSAWTNTALSSLASGLYKVSATDEQGCSTDRSFEITSPEPLSLTYTTEKNICLGGNIGALGVEVAGGAGTYNYAWTLGSSSFGGNTDTLSSLTTDDYTVTVTDDNGCAPLIQTITVDGPSTTFTIGFNKTDLTCYESGDGTLALDLTLTGAHPDDYAISWYKESDMFNSVTKTLSDLEVNNYKVIMTDTLGCTKTDSITLVQPDEINLNPVIDPLLCFDASTASITLNPTGGSDSYPSVNWSLAGTPTAKDVFFVDNLASGNYNVLMTDDNGCQRDSTMTIVNPENMAVDLVNTSIVNVLCKGFSSGSIDFSVDNGQTPYSYAWSQTGSALINSEDIEDLAIGTYDLTVTDFYGCVSDSFSFEITEPDNLYNINGDVAEVSCLDDSDGKIFISLEVLGASTDFTYVWNRDGLLLAEDIRDLANLSPATYAFIATDNFGCTKTDTFTLVNPPAITAVFETVEPSCYGDSTGSLTAFAAGGWGDYEYDWRNPLNEIGITDSVVNNLISGDYLVRITDDAGCTKHFPIPLDGPDSISIGALITDNTCHSPIDAGIAISVTGGTPDYNYQWLENGVDYATTQNIDSLTADNYELIVTDSLSCVQSSGILEVIRPDPISLTILSSQENLCTNSNTGSLFLQGSGGTFPYQYSIDGGNLGTESFFDGLHEGVHTFSITDTNNCSVDSLITVLSEYELTADFGLAYTNPYIDWPISLNDSSLATDITSWFWELGNGAIVQGQNTEVTYRAPGVYPITLKITNEVGCEAIKIDTLIIEKGYKLTMPSAFTPNGDGLNDVFKSSHENIIQSSLQLYNKYGALVFESNELNAEWNGELKDVPLPQDSYLYVIEYIAESGVARTERGRFTLLR